jgi:hypothetical protein
VFRSNLRLITIAAAALTTEHVLMTAGGSEWTSLS